jgi:hypothetical protein
MNGGPAATTCSEHGVAGLAHVHCLVGWGRPRAGSTPGWAQTVKGRGPVLFNGPAGSTRFFPIIQTFSKRLQTFKLENYKTLAY